ncbi:ScaI family restriction endonuclease [Clostridium sp.]
MVSPYYNLPKSQLIQKTQELLSLNPLNEKKIIECILISWNDILKTKIGGILQIGVDVFPIPQVMGNFLHELIPYKLKQCYPELWRKDNSKNEKDLVYIPDSNFSIEIKTSSHPSGIYGNRSYAQLGNQSGKSKAGYYLAINFEKFDEEDIYYVPKIRRIRFGWLEHTDWKAQESATGQQAKVTPDAKKYKMKEIYKV